MLTPILPIFIMALIFLMNSTTSQPISSAPPTDFHAGPHGLHLPHDHLHMAFVLLVPLFCARAARMPSLMLMLELVGSCARSCDRAHAFSLVYLRVLRPIRPVPPVLSIPSPLTVPTLLGVAPR